LPPSGNYRVKALEKGLRLLLLLRDQSAPLSLEEITNASGLNKTTCFRLLRTLQDFGFVERAPDSKRYSLGSELISLGAAARKRLSLRRLAQPYMRRLKDQTGETVNLSILDGTEVVFIARLEASHIISTHHRIGDRLPAYCTCMGKAILAHLSRERLSAILEETIFEPKTPATITSRTALLKELARVRREGLAYNMEELEKGLCAVAAPVMGQSGEAVAGLNVAFPLTRHDPQEFIQRFAPQVKQTADQISRLLGYAKE